MRKLWRGIFSFIAVAAASGALFGCSDSVTITVELNGGDSSYSRITVESGELVSIPQAPTKDGCVFDGWWTAPTGGEPFDFNKPVTVDTAIYAHWSEAIAIVDFDLNLPALGAVSSAVPSALTVKIGERFTPPTDPTCDGYVFKGWINGDTAVTADTVIDNDVTLYAKWAKLYAVTFARGMGDTPDPLEVEENTIAILPNITMDGYTLGEWCTDSGLTKYYDETQPITSDITLYAKFYKHTSLDSFYFGSVESDGYARITGIKPEAIAGIGDTLVIPDITASGEKIGKFSVLNSIDLSGIKKVVISSTLNKSFSDALDQMKNLESVVGGRGGRNYNTYAGCVYSNEDDAYYRLDYVPQAIANNIVPLRNDATKIFVESDSSDSRLTFNGLGIDEVRAFELSGAPNIRLSITVEQVIHIVFIVPDEYVNEYAEMYAKEFYYDGDGTNASSGVLVFIEKSKRDDAAYIAQKTQEAIAARDEEIRRQVQEWLGGGN